MSRLCALLAPLLFCGLIACGGKDKKGSTKPKSSGTVETKLMGDGDPDTKDPVASTDPDKSGPDGDKDGDEDGDKDGDGGEPKADGKDEPAPPKIEPPDLDLDPKQSATKVGEHLNRARAALRGTKKDPDLAIKEAQLALDVDATSLDAVAVLAHAYYAKRLHETAEVILDMTFKDRRKAKLNPYIYYVYGLIYDATDRPQQALLAYERAVDLSPDYKSALTNLGVHYLRNKRYDRAIKIYEKLTETLGVTNAITWTNLGSAYRGHSGDYDAGSGQRNNFLQKAEVAYKRALQADRNYGPVYYNLGLLYLDASPFPGPSGDMDELQRLERAKTYFDEYHNLPGADIPLVEDRAKQVKKLIKREQKRRKRATSDG